MGRALNRMVRPGIRSWPSHSSVLLCLSVPSLSLRFLIRNMGGLGEISSLSFALIACTVHGNVIVVYES